MKINILFDQKEILKDSNPISALINFDNSLTKIINQSIGFIQNNSDKSVIKPYTIFMNYVLGDDFSIFNFVQERKSDNNAICKQLVIELDNYYINKIQEQKRDIEQVKKKIEYCIGRTLYNSGFPVIFSNE